MRITGDCSLILLSVLSFLPATFAHVPNFAGYIRQSNLTSSNSTLEPECHTYDLILTKRHPIDLGVIIHSRCKKNHDARELAEKFAMGILLSGGSYFSAAAAYNFLEQESAVSFEKMFDENRPGFRSLKMSSNDTDPLLNLEKEFDEIFSPVFLQAFMDAMELDLEEIARDFDISTDFPLQHLTLANYEVRCKTEEGTAELRICMDQKLNFGYLSATHDSTDSAYFINVGTQNVPVKCCRKRRGILSCIEHDETDGTDRSSDCESTTNDLHSEILDPSKNVSTPENVQFIEARDELVRLLEVYIIIHNFEEAIRFVIPFIFGCLLILVLVLLKRCLKSKRPRNKLRDAFLNISSPLQMHDLCQKVPEKLWTIVGRDSTTTGSARNNEERVAQTNETGIQVDSTLLVHTLENGKLERDAESEAIKKNLTL